MSLTQSGDATLVKLLITAAIIVGLFILAISSLIAGMSGTIKMAGVLAYGFFFFYVLARYPDRPKRARRIMLALIFAGAAALFIILDIRGAFDLGPVRVADFPRAP